MHYLSPAEISAINEEVTALTGGSSSVRETGLLESLSVKPQATFGGEDLYPDIFSKAAVLYEGIVNYHVFIDGNKRTGLAAMAAFLHANGYDLTAGNDELVEFTLRIATTNLDPADIALWIKSHVG